jgi:hypothetical protein
MPSSVSQVSEPGQPVDHRLGQVCHDLMAPDPDPGTRHAGGKIADNVAPRARAQRHDGKLGRVGHRRVPSRAKRAHRRPPIVQRPDCQRQRDPGADKGLRNSGHPCPGIGVEPLASQRRLHRTEHVFLAHEQGLGTVVQPPCACGGPHADRGRLARSSDSASGRPIRPSKSPVRVVSAPSRQRPSCASAAPLAPSVF